MPNPELFLSYQELERKQEACGITAAVSKRGVHIAPFIARMQVELENRGRDSAGISVFNSSERKITTYRQLGRPSEVLGSNFNFTEHKLYGDRGIGHNRYGTSGGDAKNDIEGSQPMHAQWKDRRLAIAYNGNMPESLLIKLRDKIKNSLGYIPDTKFDTQAILYAIVSAEGDTWPDRIRNALRGIDMAYSITMVTGEGNVYGLKGPSAHWPLLVGESEDAIVLASETSVGKDMKWREVQGGELVEITPDGIISEQLFYPEREFRCILHDFYGAKRNSIMTIKDGKPIPYEDLRFKAGQLLAHEYPREADLYIGIPETGLDYVEGYVNEISKYSTPAITKLNGDRSFMGKTEKEIHTVINSKYAVWNSDMVRGKTVVTIDDSNIRGKTAGGSPLRDVFGNNGSVKEAKGYVDLLREAGASRVDCLFALPKFVEGCDMGYYILKEQEVALAKDTNGKYIELSFLEIANRIGADSVYYLSIGSVKEAYEWVGKDGICTNCVGGKHPLDIIEEERQRHSNSIDMSDFVSAV